MLLGIDLGAGSLKATVIDAFGGIVATASSELETMRPYPGWSEQDTDGWVRAMGAALAQLDAGGCDLLAILAVSFTAGTHTAVLLGEDGRALRPALLWSDQRSGDEAAALNARMGTQLLEIAHNCAAATWTLSHLSWLKKHEPETVGKVRRIMFAKDWLRAQLTGDFFTDRIDAEGSLMAEAGGARWSDVLCSAIGWPMETLPPILNPTDQAGVVTAVAARRFGLREGLPVIAGTSDTAAETWGAGAIAPGFGVIKLATAGTISVMASSPRPSPRLVNYGHVVPNHNYIIAGTNSCASAHRWLRDMLVGAASGREGYALLDDEAATVPCGSDGLLFHPYLEGERAPYWDAKLRADFLGLTMRHRRAHLIRALYEGIAFSLKDCSLAFVEADLSFDQLALIGGGARSKVWAQIVADVIGRTVVLPESSEASFAAAMLAGVGIGLFADEKDAVRKCVRIERELHPDQMSVDLYAKNFVRYRHTKELLTETYHSV